MELTKEDQKKLLKIARTSIENYLEKGNMQVFLEENGGLSLDQKCGAFVTLHSKDGKLRGCIGHMQSDVSLYKTIHDMAIAAAVEDPRFSPLTLDEMSNIVLEISVLSSLLRVKSADDIEMGKHGVIVKRGFKSGVFLPQVATETGWDKEEFLNNLCYGKAGLPIDAWKDKKTELYVFTAQVFSE